MLTSPQNSNQLGNSAQGIKDRFLVCGLGGLGQHCVAVLKDFGVSVSAIDKAQPTDWEIPDLPQLLETSIIGDCCQPQVLEQAKIQECRAVLLVTDNEGVNTEAAFAARSLQPQIRLIVRSSKENLNELLGQQLGNYAAFEPTQLPAAAFALAALDLETIGYFSLEGQWLRVVQRQLQSGDRWCNQRMYQINNRTRRVLSHANPTSSLPQLFYQWEPDAQVQAGDTLVTIEVTEQLDNQIQPTAIATRKRRRFLARLQGMTWNNLQQQLMQFWQSSYKHQVRRVALVCGVIVLSLLAIGTALFNWYYPYNNPLKAFYTTSVLLLGGYADLFADVEPKTFPWGLQLFSLGLTLAGTAFVGVLYALLTETLLSARFQFLKPRPPAPQQDHVVLVGLGRVGQRVAALLQEFKQPLVAISTTQIDQNVLPQLPLIVGNIANALRKANLPDAKSVVVVTDDEMVNLEVGLMAREANPNTNLVVRTYKQRLSENVAQVLPGAQVICAYAVAAEALAAAAFGEKIISLFRLNHRTILVTEYNIEAGDTLDGLLLAEIAYGYGVVPILLFRVGEEPRLMPSDDTLLVVGDRLVVLANINSLQRIERGKRIPQRWWVQVDKTPTPEAAFEGANAIARVSGCNISDARELINHLPGILKFPLYKHQAQRLVRELSKTQVSASIVPSANNPGNNVANTPNARTHR